MKSKESFYDATLKSLFLKSPPTLMARATRGRKIKEALNVEQRRVRPVKARNTDLVFLLDDGALLHCELQSRNESKMPWRLMDYRAEFRLKGERRPIEHCVLYVGAKPMRMHSRIRDGGLAFEFQLIDIREYRAADMLASGNPSDIVLALLAGGIGDPRELARMVAMRIGSLPESVRPEALAAAILLSPLRNSERMIKEAAVGLNLDWRDNAILREMHDEGRDEGREEGREEGLQTALLSQLTHRFGPLPQWAAERVHAAGHAQVDRWLHDIFEARSLDALLRPRRSTARAPRR